MKESISFLQGIWIGMNPPVDLKYVLCWVMQAGRILAGGEFEKYATAENSIKLVKSVNLRSMGIFGF